MHSRCSWCPHTLVGLGGTCAFMMKLMIWYFASNAYFHLVSFWIQFQKNCFESKWFKEFKNGSSVCRWRMERLAHWHHQSTKTGIVLMFWSQVWKIWMWNVTHAKMMLNSSSLNCLCVCLFVLKCSHLGCQKGFPRLGVPWDCCAHHPHHSSSLFSLSCPFVISRCPSCGPSCCWLSLT